MALVKDEIIVIKGINYSEADKILTVFSRNRGKFSMIAKGVRKIESKNRSAIQTLSRSSVTYYEGINLASLVEAGLIFTPDIEKEQLANISKVLRIVNKLVVDDVDDPPLYERLALLLQEEYNLREVNKFRIWLLEHLGFLPDMRVCTVCHINRNTVGIDLSEMAVICDSCLRKERDQRRYLDLSKVKYQSIAFDKAIDSFLDKIINQNSARTD